MQAPTESTRFSLRGSGAEHPHARPTPGVLGRQTSRSGDKAGRVFNTDGARGQRTVWPGVSDPTPGAALPCLSLPICKMGRKTSIGLTGGSRMKQDEQSEGLPTVPGAVAVTTVPTRVGSAPLLPSCVAGY